MLAATAAAGRSVFAQLVVLFPQEATALSQDAIPSPGEGGFLTARERSIVAAIFDRIIPADDLSPGAVELGCVEFLDRQLAGDWGHATATYRDGPFVAGTAEQGPQDRTTPRERYRAGLAAIDDYARRTHRRAFPELAASQQDALLTAMERGALRFREGDAQVFFALMVSNAREGFLADPLYGGNKGMAGWRMVGFPGARYDYRDVIDRRGEDLGLEPVSLLDPARTA